MERKDIGPVGKDHRRRFGTRLAMLPNYYIKEGQGNIIKD